MEQFNFLIMGENGRFEIKSLPTEGMTFFTNFGWFDDFAVVVFYKDFYRIIHAATGFCIASSPTQKTAIEAAQTLLIDVGEKNCREAVKKAADLLKQMGIPLPINDLALLNKLNHNLQHEAYRNEAT